MKPAALTTEGWPEVDVPCRVQADALASLRVDDMKVVKILLLRCQYTDGSEENWALPWVAVERIAELAGATAA
jgi:hypothetical protein